MKHSFPHSLDRDTAKQAAEKAWAVYQERFAKFNPTMTWEDTHRAAVGFSAKGVKVEGQLEVKDSTIEMELEVPFLLRPFKKKAVDIIGSEIQHWVEKAKSGDM